VLPRRPCRADASDGRSGGGGGGGGGVLNGQCGGGDPTDVARFFFYISRCGRSENTDTAAGRWTAAFTTYATMRVHCRPLCPRAGRPGPTQVRRRPFCRNGLALPTASGGPSRRPHGPVRAREPRVKTVSFYIRPAISDNKRAFLSPRPPSSLSSVRRLGLSA